MIFHYIIKVVVQYPEGYTGVPVTRFLLLDLEVGFVVCLFVNDAARKTLIAKPLNSVTIISLEQIPINETHGSKGIQTTTVSGGVGGRPRDPRVTTGPKKPVKGVYREAAVGPPFCHDADVTGRA